MNKKRRNKPGPVPDVLRIDGDWREAMKKLVHKKKPPEGWPDEKGKPKQK